MHNYMRSFWLMLPVGCLMSIPSAGQFPANVVAQAPNGTNGFIITGHLVNQFGGTLSGIGDVNADGIDDFASGGGGNFFPPPPGACEQLNACPQMCTPNGGGVFVIFGRPGIGGDGSWSTEDIDGTGTYGFYVPGLHANDGAWIAKPAGDFNTDGIDDFMIGAAYASPLGIAWGGAVYVIYGNPGLGSEGFFDLGTLDGENGFVIGGERHLGLLSASLDSLGDFNGDGYDDIVVGDSPYLSTTAWVYVLYGRPEIGESGQFSVPGQITPRYGLIIHGDVHNARSAGDFNGDGLHDLLLSVEGVGDYLVYGGLATESGVFDPFAEVDGTNGFLIEGGGASTGVGDVNADGYDDIACKGYTAGTGYWVGVIFGGPDVAPSGVFCLDDLDGTNGFRIIRSSGTTSTASFSGGTGDFNSDGVDDMYFSLWRGWVLFGKPGIGSSGVIAIETFDGSEAVQVPTGAQTFLGDVNGDGIDDLGSGWSAMGNVQGGQCIVGKTWTVFGRRMGDGNIDGDVDFDDFAAFEHCRLQSLNLGPPNGGNQADLAPDECHPFDFDKDNDVDLDDFAGFQRVFATAP